MRAADWRGLLASWDRQQESFNTARERRFQAMLDAVGATLPARLRALDLGCGPGSLSARLLARFPRARSVAVDYDPVVLEIGRRALGTQRGRLTWVDANLGGPRWDAALPVGRYDAALSTTALHWLTPQALRTLYRDLARRIRPGGVFLNGDFLPWGTSDQRFSRMASKVRAVRYRTWKQGRQWEAWTRWWADAEALPALGSQFAERRRRFPEHHPHSDQLSLEFHRRALRAAGFRSSAVVWQELDDRVLMAIR